MHPSLGYPARQPIERFCQREQLPMAQMVEPDLGRHFPDRGGGVAVTGGAFVF